MLPGGQAMSHTPCTFVRAKEILGYDTEKLWKAILDGSLTNHAEKGAPLLDLKQVENLLLKNKAPKKHGGNPPEHRHDNVVPRRRADASGVRTTMSYGLLKHLEKKFCRDAENRTRTAHSRSAHTTTIRRPATLKPTSKIIYHLPKKSNVIVSGI